MKKLVAWLLTTGLLLSVTPAAFAATKPQVVVERYSLSPNPAPLNQEFTLVVTLKNYGGAAAQNLTFNLNVGELVSPLGKGNVRYLSSLGSDTEQTFTFQLISEGSPTARNLNLSGDLSYEDEAGNGYSGSQAIGVLFTKRADGGEAEKVEEAKPYLTITGYETSPDRISPGDSFTLALTVKNNGKNGIKNLLVSLGAASSPAKDDKDNGASASQADFSGGTTILTTGSGNARYISYLGAGDKETISFDLIANPKAASGSYELGFGFEFESGTGKSFSSSQSISINLSRLVTFSWQNLDYPKEVEVGRMFTVSGEAINDNDFTVGGIKLEFDGEDLGVQDDNIFVGSLESGDSESLEAKVRAKRTGVKQARFIVKYRDDFNRERQIEKVIRIKVVPKPKAVRERVKPTAESGGFFQGLANFFKALLGIG